jgi:hypothetical protein
MRTSSACPLFVENSSTQGLQYRMKIHKNNPASACQFRSTQLTEGPRMSDSEKPTFNLNLSGFVDDTIDFIQSTSRAVIDSTASAFSSLSITADPPPAQSPPMTSRHHIKCVLLGDDITHSDRSVHHTSSVPLNFS